MNYVNLNDCMTGSGEIGSWIEFLYMGFVVVAGVRFLSRLKYQWLLFGPLCGFVGSQTPINVEEGFVGGAHMATGNPICPFSSWGKIFTCSFLPVVKHLYPSECAWVGWFVFLKKWWFALKQKSRVEVSPDSLRHWVDCCWTPRETSEMQERAHVLLQQLGGGCVDASESGVWWWDIARTTRAPW